MKQNNQSATKVIVSDHLQIDMPTNIKTNSHVALIFHQSILPLMPMCVNIHPYIPGSKAIERYFNKETKES